MGLTDGKGYALSKDLAAETKNKQMLSLTGKLKFFAESKGVV